MTKLPEGFGSVTPFVVMDDVAAAIEFYKKALGAEVTMSLPTPDGKIMYAELQIGNSRIMIGVPCPESGGDAKSAKSLGGSPVSFYVYVDNVESAFDKAKDAGMAEKKEIHEMFWGDKMGSVTDPFGIDWTVAQHIRDVSPEEVEEAMKKMAC